MSQHTSTSASHGNWPEIARLADEIGDAQVAETASGPVPVHELANRQADHQRTVSVVFTLAELRALDDLVQVGASVMLRHRGTFAAAELSGAQRKLRTAQLSALRA